MALSDHSELIATVTELKVLLDTLAGIDPDTLCLPPRDTGVHPSDIFNADAATAAGFTSEAVLVLSAIPYFTCGARFGHSVTEKTYIGSGCDQNSFEGCREVFGRDVMMPPEVVPLTDSDGGYGIIYIYDTKKKLIYPWAPLLDTPAPEDDDGSVDTSVLYTHVTPKSPREALQPVIDKFRGLHFIMRPLMVEEHSNHELVEDNEYEDAESESSEDRDYKVWQAVMYLKDLYLECGWNVDEVEQTNFRRDVFLARRRQYLLDVVEPLEDSEDGI